ncbi:protein of unknown function [Xenorhabdus doucetiae]|uniref:Uncharacterized protein n=1 Tax=Xenorhabdus doucetiae TaxID=351671 RepID=A0A068QNC6_9GAMM|nr:protein of unknown function [Xenorhabdus doucetiae]
MKLSLKILIYHKLDMETQFIYYLEMPFITLCVLILIRSDNYYKKNQNHI